MTHAETILKMIEEVDPNDTAKLQEIDLSVARFVYGFATGHKYTRSLDALKCIQPKGWWIDTKANVGCVCVLYHGGSDQKGYVHSPIGNNGEPFEYGLPTEYLARLHAIIQAIQHERTK